MCRIGLAACRRPPFQVGASMSGGIGAAQRLNPTTRDPGLEPNIDQPQTSNPPNTTATPALRPPPHPAPPRHAYAVPRQRSWEGGAVLIQRQFRRRQGAGPWHGTVLMGTRSMNKSFHE